MNKKILLTILVLGLVGCGFLVCSPVQAGVPSDFSNKYQISFTGTNTNPDADIDASGKAYVVYERSGSIYYKMNRGVEQLVATGTNPDLAVDSAGVAHVAYLSGENVMYTKLVAGVWSAPTIVAAGDYATIDTDSSNNVFISYSAINVNNYSTIYLADNTSGSFVIKTIKEDSDLNDHLDENYTTPNIKIDSNGNYHIAFIYTNNAGNGESYVQIETDAVDGDSTSADYVAGSISLGRNCLALNGSTAYIAFKQTPSKIKYAEVTTTTTWTETTVLAGGGFQPVIAVNGAIIGVAYVSGGNIVYKEGAITEPVDAGTNPVVLLGSHYAYYEKLGNIWLATDQTINDSNPPVVTGVIEGGIYNTDKTITFTDEETVPTATLTVGVTTTNPTSPFIVSDEGVYTLVVTDGTNTVTINFTIDKTAPTIGAMTNMTVEATGPSGAIVTYTNPTATDNIDAAPSVTCLPASGSTFALGATTVNCNSTDAAGNTTATPTTFTITVQDTTHPTVSGVTEGTTYTSAVTITFSDTVSAVTASLTGPSDISFTSGQTLSTNGSWTLTVTDAALNATTVHFTVSISTGGGGGGTTYYTIVASAGTNGSITPTGSTTVTYGGSQTYTITPATGYNIVAVLVDNVSVGAVATYTFSNITGGHTISATFSTTPPPATKIGDINKDGKVDEYDFAIMMSQWGQTGSGLSADLNNDGKVDEYDFALLMANWGI